MSVNAFTSLRTPQTATRNHGLRRNVYIVGHIPHYVKRNGQVERFANVKSIFALCNLLKENNLGNTLSEVYKLVELHGARKS
jgi:hypothetical protein